MNILLFVCFVLLELSFAKKLICQNEKLLSVGDQAYIALKLHGNIDPITDDYVSITDSTAYCISCQRTPPTGCKANCDEGFAWSSDDLECVDINECAPPSPCVHGTCNEEIGGYSCSCADGYTGVNCEIDIDECEPQPCFYGTCHDEIADYSCECDVGYTGVDCETNIDDCIPDPCLHGTCHDEIADYSCECDVGYTGVNCETVRSTGNVECTDYDPCSGGARFYRSVVGTDRSFISCDPTCFLLDCVDTIGIEGLVDTPGIRTPTPDFTIFPCLPVPDIECRPCIFIQDTYNPAPGALAFVPTDDPTEYIECHFSPLVCIRQTCPPGTSYSINPEAPVTEVCS